MGGGTTTGEWYCCAESISWLLERSWTQAMVCQSWEEQAVTKVYLPIIINCSFIEQSSCFFPQYSHVTHLYSDGDICELTAKPRRVRVKFRYSSIILQSSFVYHNFLRVPVNSAYLLFHFFCYYNAFNNLWVLLLRILIVLRSYVTMKIKGHAGTTSNYLVTNVW